MNSFARHTLWFVSMIAMVASIALAGCGSNSGGNGAPPAVIAPVGPSSGPAVNSGLFLASNLQIKDRTTFELFLQNAQLCSPRIVGWNIGNANCSSYSSAAYMYLQVVGGSVGALPNSTTVTIGAGAGTPFDYNHSGWTTVVLRPTFSTNVAYTNNNQGFTGTGYYGFRYVVNSGLPANSYQMNVDLIYNGIVFASGTLIAQ